MSQYLCIGLGFYIALAIRNWRTFNGASLVSCIGGLILGIAIWPIGVLVLWLDQFYFNKSAEPPGLPPETGTVVEADGQRKCQTLDGGSAGTEREE